MKILLLEDNAADADLSIRALYMSFPECIIHNASDISEATRILNDITDFDVALLDLQLPDGSGMEVLVDIRQKGMDLAVVLLTGTGDEDVAVAALKAGANDFVIKDIGYNHKLPGIINYSLNNHKNVKELIMKVIPVLYIEHHASDVDYTLRSLTRYAPYISVESVQTAEEALKLLLEN